jgi:regulator of cell morphogenesis and NO signaling
MITEMTPIAQIVLDHSECARVLQRLRVDYCCHGELSLDAACRRRGLKTADVQAELERAVQARGSIASHDPRELSTPALLDLILHRHHEHVREALPFLVPLAAKVVRVHGDNEPSLVELRDELEDLSEELLPHLDDEKDRVFPSLSERPAAAGELERLKAEHQAIGDGLSRVREAARGFAVPHWACGSYTTLMHELEALEAALIEQLHLENHVLLPRFRR